MTTVRFSFDSNFVIVSQFYRVGNSFNLRTGKLNSNEARGRVMLDA